MNRILFVDDEEGIQLLYREELEEDGYEVHSVLTGEDALQKLQFVSPDLVILDIKMPGMSGIEVLRQIKGKNPNMPVILNTGYQEYKQVGARTSDDYIVKSGDLNELKAAIRRHLS